MDHFGHLLLELALALAALRAGSGFAAFTIFAFFLSGRRWTSLTAIAFFLGVVAWWVSIPPSHDRPWRPEVAVMPRAVIEGDHVRITGVRNFEYQSRNDFTVRYRSVSCSCRI